MSLPSVVHLDLKGAPWKVDFLCKVIPILKANGAWGVLLEWEDTFPYTGELVDVGSIGGSSREGLYTLDEVKWIIQCIKQNNMQPIQLVQTIGHMEFVLKHGQFRHLRELPRSPSVLCPSRPESKFLVKSMVKQVLDAQPDAEYIHIGADEVWYMDKCADCSEKCKRSENGSLYLDHIRTLATYIKELCPHITIIMWDDMLRPLSVDLLKAYSIGNLIEPVIWNYNVKEQFNIDVKLWEKYSFVFRNLWVASAYKGANGSSQMVCSVPRYASNQLAWRNEISIYENKLNFSGIILTGWSRYDHYATLCELLPAALPSLATCLRMWSRPDGFTDGRSVVEALPAAQWPGREVAAALAAAHALRTRSLQFLDGDHVMGWMNSWQIDHEFTSPIQADHIAICAKQLQEELSVLGRSLLTMLGGVTGCRSSCEFVHTYLTPLELRAHELRTRAEARSRAPAGTTPR